MIMSDKPTTDPPVQQGEGSGLLPCPRCKDCWALQLSPPTALPLQTQYVLCGRCRFSAPLESWQARATVSPEVGAAERRLMNFILENDYDDEDVEIYISNLPWSTEASEFEKTIVAANIRTFWQSLKRIATVTATS